MKEQPDPNAAITELYNRTFGSFKSWLKMMGDDSGIQQYKQRLAGQRPQDKLGRILLWWCIWGEAGNCRFMPEYLSWVFYRLDNKQQQGASLAPGDFLKHTIKPMYNFLKREMGMGFGVGKVDKAGVTCEHVDIKNYDDINEFFWTSKCLDACHQPDETNCKFIEGTHKKTYYEKRGILHSVKSNMRVVRITRS